MAAETFTGRRIRDRRMRLGLKQAELARSVGVSPSYLNLIEHNRRSIGGKVLADLAQALGVDAAALTEGVGSDLMATLRGAAAGATESTPELDRIEDFTARFPGWAELVAELHRRGGRLERLVETLSERMTHDPFLSASLHEVLSAVTAIQSTAAILAETEDIGTEWQARFHRNLGDDAGRVADAAHALVSYLAASGAEESVRISPPEEVEAFLHARDWHIAELEQTVPPAAEALAAEAPEIVSASGRALAEAFFARYRTDAEAMPLAAFEAAARDAGYDPGRLAQRFESDPIAVFRRLAALPPAAGRPAIGLAVCDGSGTLTLRKPVDDFPLPRFGAGCPLWPLFRALARPTEPLRTIVEQPGGTPRRFLTYALCRPTAPAEFGGPVVLESAMLILPADLAAASEAPVTPVGTSCRICPRAGCPARREPSILAAGL